MRSVEVCGADVALLGGYNGHHTGRILCAGPMHAGWMRAMKPGPFASAHGLIIFSPLGRRVRGFPNSTCAGSEGTHAAVRGGSHPVTPTAERVFINARMKCVTEMRACVGRRLRSDPGYDRRALCWPPRVQRTPRECFSPLQGVLALMYLVELPRDAAARTHYQKLRFRQPRSDLQCVSSAPLSPPPFP